MNIQIIMAHPDDEVIFGWPVLQQASSILICSNDRNNPERAWCKDRYKALEEIGQLLDVPVKSLDYPSEFYRLNARDGSLARFQADVRSHIDPKADLIYTHNSYGEYGHLDHILVHLTLMDHHSGLITSDICLNNGWMTLTKEIRSRKTPGYFFKLAENDLAFYDQCKAIYEKHGTWTWNMDPVLTCKLFSL